MSSHHIIREHQEPALYVHDWSDSYAEVFGQLCEWSPKIYSNANTDLILKKKGVKVDECLGPVSDVLEVAVKLREQIEHVNVLCADPSVVTEMQHEALVFLNDRERAFYRSTGHSKWYSEGVRFRVRKREENEWQSFLGEGKVVSFKGACWVLESY